MFLEYLSLISGSLSLPRSISLTTFLLFKIFFVPTFHVIYDEYDTILGVNCICYYVQSDCQTQLTYFHRPTLHIVRWSQGLLIGQPVHTHIVLWLHMADMWFGRSVPLVEYLNIAHTSETPCLPWDQAGTTGNWDCCPTRKNRPCMLLKHR